MIAAADIGAARGWIGRPGTPADLAGIGRLLEQEATGPPLGLVTAMDPWDDARVALDGAAHGSLSGVATLDLYRELWGLQLDGTFGDVARRRAALLELTYHPAAQINADPALLRRLLALRGSSESVHAIGASPGASDHRSALPRIWYGAADSQFDQPEVPEADTHVLATLVNTWRIELGGGFAVPQASLPERAAVDGRLGEHLVRRSQVDAFLAGSEVPHTLFHGNRNPDKHAKVLGDGPDVRKNKRALYGRGFYTAFTPPSTYGDVVEVAVRTRSPFVTDFSGFLNWKRGVDLDPVDPAASMRAAMLAAGHDSLVMLRDANDGGDWLVALRNEDVRVVVKDDDALPDARPPAPSRYVAAGAAR